jgi:hypothetical protein
MWGTNPRIYRHSLDDIHSALDQCSRSIRHTNSIEQSWDILTTGLQWTNVITSKILHFLCRALDIQQDPPVVIDDAVILKKYGPDSQLAYPRPSVRRAGTGMVLRRTVDT